MRQCFVRHSLLAYAHEALLRKLIDVRELFSIKKLIGTVMRRENWNLSFNVSLIKESSQSQRSFAFEDYLFFQLNMTRLVLKMEWNILSFLNKKKATLNASPLGPKNLL